VEYLGHLITPQGLKPNPKQVQAVIEFPVLESVTNVRSLVLAYPNFSVDFVLETDACWGLCCHSTRMTSYTQWFLQAALCHPLRGITV